IAYWDQTNNEANVIHCTQTACTSGTITVADTSFTQNGIYDAITLGADGLGILVFQDTSNNDLRVAHCNNTTCTNLTTTSIDTGGTVGSFDGISIGVDGLPLISEYDATNQALRVGHCANASCTAATFNNIDTGNVGQDTSITVGNDGLGLISYRDA